MLFTEDGHGAPLIICLAPKSSGSELSFEALFVSVVALVLSEHRKWLEKITSDVIKIEPSTVVFY